MMSIRIGKANYMYTGYIESCTSYIIKIKMFEKTYAAFTLEKIYTDS